MKEVLFIKIFGQLIVLLLRLWSGIVLYVWLKPFVAEKRNAIGTAAVYVSVVLLLDLVPADTSNLSGCLIIFLVLVLVLWLHERDNIEQKVFAVIIFQAIRQVTAEAAGEINLCLSHQVSRIEAINSSVPALLVEFTVQEIFWAALNVVGLYFAIWLFQKVFKVTREKMSRSELVIMLMPTLPIFMMRILRYRYIQLWDYGILTGVLEQNYGGDVVNVIYDVAAYFLLLLVVSLYQKNRDNAQELKELALLDVNRKALERHIRQVEKLYDEQKSLRHDMANHLQTMERLVQAGETKDAKEYLDNMKAELSKAAPKVFGGNPVVDIILGEYEGIAREQGIAFEAKFGWPENTKLSAFDVSVILSNGLSNAVRAAKECEQPYVRVCAGRRKNVLLIEMRNNYAGELRLDEATGLPDRICGQGIGLKNIRRTAEKYDGAMDIELTKSEDGQEFVLTVMMQIA